jgi:hypothetical protein
VKSDCLPAPSPPSPLTTHNVHNDVGMHCGRLWSIWNSRWGAWTPPPSTDVYTVGTLLYHAHATHRQGLLQRWHGGPLHCSPTGGGGIYSSPGAPNSASASAAALLPPPSESACGAWTGVHGNTYNSWGVCYVIQYVLPDVTNQYPAVKRLTMIGAVLHSADLV